MTEPLLVVEDLVVRFGTTVAVDGVSFSLHPDEVLAVVGESGSGKTTMALALAGILTAGTVEAGRLQWRGEDLLALPANRRRRLLGREIGVVFQDPGTSLDPVQRVGTQVAELLRVHEGERRGAASRRAIDLLEQVGIPDPSRRARQYPHQLSGGMRQRVAIAMAIACRPSLLLADEPTSALDVTVQAQVLDLLLAVKDELTSAVLLITHDFGVVAGIADRTMVLYSGRAVETGSTDRVLGAPVHPYTQGLLAAVPRIDGKHTVRAIPGSPPAAASPVGGCAFHPRCSSCLGEICTEQDPVLVLRGVDHAVACHLATGGRGG